MSADAVEPSKPKLTSTDILARARAAVGQKPAVSPDRDFTEDILDDIADVLTILEQRVANGPKSLSSEDLVNIEKKMDNIKQEMFEKIGSNQSNVSSKNVAPILEQEPAKNVPHDQDQRSDELKGQKGEKGFNESEGIGYGLAKGTANTYIIDGMDEMTGEEYRKALQETVSARQRKRAIERKGVVGNRASHQYLDSIGWGGTAKKLAGK